MTRLHRWMAAVAAIAGGLAPFAGRRARIDVEDTLATVAAERDHVSAVELAAWLRERRPVRVVDVRTADEYRAYHIPGATHVAFADLATARFAPDETLVLYSETGVHAAQAWMVLRALGHRETYFLRRGLHEWLEDVLDQPAPLRGRGC